jgi:teichuronic acid biosynthesis glycosyltransferase TuaG
VRVVLVSVIIPHRNSAATLARALTSIIAQTRPDWEAIVVDDASDQPGALLPGSRIWTDPRIRMIRLPRRGGIAQARNAGIDAARGRLIAFLDADDLWHPAKLARQVPVVLSGAPLVCSGYRRITPAGRILSTVVPPARIDHAAALGSNPIGCLTAIWDRQALGEARLPDLPMHEDYAFWLAMLRKGAVATGLPEILADYVVTPGSHSQRKWQAARVTWEILRDEPGLALTQRMGAFARYAGGALVRRLREVKRR